MTNEEMYRLLHEVLPFIGYEGEGSQGAAEKVRQALEKLQEELDDEEDERNAIYDYEQREKLYT